MKMLTAMMNPCARLPGIVLIHLIVLGSVAQYSQAQTTGEWTTAAGSLVKMDCPSEYRDLTRLPQGCVNGLVGGGILWTPDATSKNDADLQKASSLISGLKVNIEELRESIKRTAINHISKMDDLSTKASDHLKQIESSHRSSIVTSFTVGAALGVLVYSAISIAL